MLKGSLLARRQHVEPGRDRGLHRVRKPIGPSPVVVGNRPRDLLGEEWVAARGLGDPRGEIPGLGRQQRHGQRAGGLAGQGPQLDLGDVPRRAAEVRSTLEQLGPARADDHQRGVTEAKDHLLDQIEESIVGPVRVVDPDHEWAVRGEQGYQPAPCVLQLVLDVPLGRVTAERRRESCRQGVGVGGAELGEARCERLMDLSNRVVGARAGSGPHDLAERPECDPSAIGRISPDQDPGTRLGRAKRTEELRREARLADPGIPGDHHQLGRSVAGGAPVGELEQGEIVIATDQRRACAPGPSGLALIG